MYTVLIADDEHIERAFLRQVLEGAGDRYRVIGEANNGQEALALAKALRPDVALVDINMPVLNGLEVARQVKSLYPGMVVVLNSAYQEFEFAQQAISSGVNAYLIKPAGAALILSTLDGCMGKREIALPSGATLGFSPEGSYPYEITDRILNGIATRNASLSASGMEDYLRFFQGKKTYYQHYQLFILNTIFSIRHALMKIEIPGELIQLFSDHVYLTRISQAKSWYEILLHLEEYFDRLRLLLGGCGGQEVKAIPRVVQYIDENYAQRITLNGLAELVHLSPSYLSRRFHQEMGMPIRDYMIQKRMGHACRLLQTSALSIREVSEMCGFSNLSYFYNICKKQTGVSPAQLRRQATDTEV